MEATALVNKLGIAIVSKNEGELSSVASALSNEYSGAEIRRIWKTVEAELTSKDIVWVHQQLQSVNQVSELSAPLTDVEIIRKATIENSFKAFLNSFVDRGNDLKFLRDNKLYRNEFPNWETYCQFKLGISYRHAHRLIEAAMVVNQLKEDEQCILPSSESIAREVAKIKPIDRPLLWGAVLDKSEQEEEPITANFVVQVARDFKRESKPSSGNIELVLGELIEFKRGRAKLWGEVRNIYSDGACVIFDGVKDLIIQKNKISKLSGDYIQCSRINQLHNTGNKLTEDIAAQFHSVFKFEDWHLEVITILEKQCCN